MACELNRRVYATCAGNPRPPSGSSTPELEVLFGHLAIAQHLTRAGPQQVLSNSTRSSGARPRVSAGL